MRIWRPRTFFSNFFENIADAAPERLVASGVACTHPISANPHRRDFQKSENQRYALTGENQGTLGLYLALECKCAFGAKILKISKTSKIDETLKNEVQKIFFAKYFKFGIMGKSMISSGAGTGGTRSAEAAVLSFPRSRAGSRI